ncbi:MAG: orotidine 5'-phosphate decarboxylase / HUMPS family protein [Desulfurococcaceae archaeon]
MYPVLQVALDLEDLVKAVDVASKVAVATNCDHTWIEVGTPLLKAWGKLAVKALKELTKCYLVADTKTMDVPRAEAKIVLEAGADAFTVLAVADDDTLREALETKKQYGKGLVLDLIGQREPYKRAVEVARYEPDIILFHVGISSQRYRGVTGEELVKEAIRAKEELGVRVGVAGGLKPGTIGPIVSQGIDVVVVGSAITSSKDPAVTSVSILREMGIRFSQ